MSQPSRPVDPVDSQRRRPDHDHSRGASRWAVVGGIILAVALLGLIVFLHVSGAIGPGVH